MAADLRIAYPAQPARSRVRLAPGALASLGPLTRRATGARRVVVVSDARVAALHGDLALRSLRRAGVAVDLVLVPRGEAAKRPEVAARLWTRLAALGLSRRDAIVALGGGALGDLAGFVASTWLRGVAWVCVPTTVLAQVDSSVGGKTGINLGAGKNLVGSFHQPVLVVSDPETLSTLPPRQRRAGLAELAKVGMATDARLFQRLERDATRLAAGEPGAIARAVRAGVAAKARIVRRDERERECGVRTALNFGHTLGHAIEAARGYRGILHGEAVAVGMRAAARLSERLEGLASSERARLDALLDALHLPRAMPPTAVARLHGAMRHDKKRARLVRWVLTPRIGHASVPRPIERRLVEAVMLEVGARR